MKNKYLSYLLILMLTSVVSVFFAACEGPAGIDGINGADANESCKQCHNPEVVDAIAVQFGLSKHGYGEAAFEESGNTSCAPCHTSEGFKYVCKNNIPASFLADASHFNVFVNQYSATSSTSYGELGCFTCHSNLHTSYELEDFSPLTTVAPVSMNFLGGTQTIDLQADDHRSNLCVKCHQPRPFAQQWNKKPIIDLADLKNNPNDVIYNGSYNSTDTTTDNITGNLIRPGYRTHTHYGTVGAIYAGKGGVEFGSGYSNSPHTNSTSCQDCHMAQMSGRAGGHTFKVRASTGALGSNTSWNFNGCNVSGCHGAGSTSGVISSGTSSKYWKQTRSEVQTLLNSLAAKLVVHTEYPVGSGTYIDLELLNRNPDSESNLWAGLTTNNYDGYLNVFDPINNPDGQTYNSIQFRNPSTTGWSTAQKNTNNSFPIITLTKKQFGALINFQLCLREFSLGIHNTAYTKTLLTNTLAMFP